MNDTYTLWQLLKEYKIEIPIIQRDYAQGRIGKEKLRKNFIEHLREALKGGNRIQLDFIYGVVSEETLAPLDGQQRLTTLWLLHWYLAYKAKMVKMGGVSKMLMRFSYQTRDSSRDFCRRLSEFSQEHTEGNISENIGKQNWFCSYWKQDPTVQSMLRMLEAIQIAFDKCDYNQMWKSLTDSSCPITFYFLDLVGLKQSDDLYLKMNARGEQLTDFENFKADLSEYLTDRKDAEEYKGLLDLREGLQIKMDRDWASIFWKEDTDAGDEAYMAFINRFFLNRIILDKNADQTDKYNGNDFETKSKNKFFDYFYGRSPEGYIGNECIDDSRIDYSDFKIYLFDDGKLPASILWSLSKTLDGYIKFIKTTECNDISELTSSSWGEKLVFIPQYEWDEEKGKEKETTNFGNEDIKQVKRITQNERVLFHAVCRFMEQVQEQDADTLKTAFQQWLRVVWNLVSDNRIRSITGMVSQIRLVDKLSEAAMNIYDGLQNLSITQEENAEAKLLMSRLEEEKDKAGKIRENIDWEGEFKKHESSRLTRGTIRFLFRDAENNLDWTNYSKKGAQLDKLNKAFENKANKDDIVRHLKDLIAHSKTWTELGAIEYDCRRDTWIKNLTDESLRAVVHSYMLQEVRAFTDPDSRHQHAYGDLTKTDLLSNMKYGSEEINGCRLRDDKYGLIALFPANAKSESKKFVLGNERNIVMADMINNEGYECIQRVTSTNLFWGWDIYFTDLDKQKFQWTIEWVDGSGWTPKLYARNDKNEKLDESDPIISGKLISLRKKFGIN